MVNQIALSYKPQLTNLIYYRIACLLHIYLLKNALLEGSFWLPNATLVYKNLDFRQSLVGVIEHNLAVSHYSHRNRETQRKLYKVGPSDQPLLLKS